MIKLNYYKKSNHCYPDLVEKSNGVIKAQIRATLWSNTFFRINANFVKNTGKPLSNGMNILFLAQVKHDVMHGLTLNILEIDTDYEIGQLAKSKNDCIVRLKKLGFFGLNKSLPFPKLPKRIAVISVDTSKGYQDFVNILKNNTRGYHFFHMLFPALLQGDAAVDSIIEQLDNIRKVKHHFDLVTIIRGGGGDVGLACYDEYDLAVEVARFPIPVVSGIGHSTNETVVEMVANYNPITPTDLAYFLQQQFDNNAVVLNEFQTSISSIAKTYLREQNSFLMNFAAILKGKSDRYIQNEKHDLQRCYQSIRQQSEFILKSNRQKISSIVNIMHISPLKSLISNRQSVKHIEEKIELLKPENLFKKGYSLSLHKGKPIADISELSIGDIVQTKTLTGELESKITKIIKK